MMFKGVLEGVKILDLSSVVLGPMTTQYLGDMGADIIKIEAPEGDITRSVGPRRSEGMGALFLANNRNKRSVVLDLKTQPGQAALRRMVASSDVIVHSIRTSSAARLGLSYSDLSQLNPRLIYCHLKGFSDEGPYAGKAAYDDVVQALSGLAMLQAITSGEPRYVPSIIADKITGVHAAYAIALALYHRERSGEGQQVGVPMLETMVAFNMAEHLGGYVFEPAVGSMGYEPIRQGMRRPFKTKDGYLCILPYTDANWHQFFDLIGRSDLATDTRFTTKKGRQAHQGVIWNEVMKELSGRTTAEWLSLMEGADVPYAVVNDLEDLLTDPHLERIGFWKLIEHPTEGMLRFADNPLEMPSAPPSIRRPPPNLGEHTAEVLREFGFTSNEIGQFTTLGMG